MTNALRTDLLLEKATFTADRPATRHAMVKLEATSRPEIKRPPLDLVACVDVSGSMNGRKLAEVQRALVALARELGASDRLGITSFETEAAQVLPPVHMTPAGKARLREAVGRLRPLGSTNMSGGLLRAVSELKAVPPLPGEALRRVLLFTDGHANHGLPQADRDGWATFLGAQLEGLRVSWFGFGEDHDADFLSFLADRSRGNAYVARDEDAITDAFAHELGGLLGARALDLEVTVQLSRGEVRLLNDETTERQGERLTVRLDDLSCEERKDLVFELALPALPRGETSTLRAELAWRDVVTGQRHEATHEVQLEAGQRAKEAPNAEVLEALAIVLAAQAQRTARELAEQGRFAEAVGALSAAVTGLRDAQGERAQALAQVLGGLVHDYRTGDAYRGNRSKLRAAERSLSKQRSSGSEIDSLFETETKRRLSRDFKGS